MTQEESRFGEGLQVKARDGRSFFYFMKMPREAGFAIVPILQMRTLKLRDLPKAA